VGVGIALEVSEEVVAVAAAVDDLVDGGVCTTVETTTVTAGVPHTSL
jgi:hypothetical protein